MGIYRLIVDQFRKDLPGQLFAQFDPPLIEAENVPDHALNEDLVFVHGDQTAKGSGSKLLEQD